MDSLFTFFEIVLIRNEIGLKSFQEIADILEKPLNDVKEIAHQNHLVFVNIPLINEYNLRLNYKDHY